MAHAENNIKQALIVVDPGGSKFSLKIAQKIADKLTEKKLSVKLVKVNQYKPQDLAGIDLLVLGGPTYMAQPSGGLKKFVSNLSTGTGLKTLLFQTGGSDCAGLAPLTELAKSKGLKIIESCSIITPKEDSEIDNKINKFVENI